MLLRTKFKRFQNETEENFQGAAGDILYLDGNMKSLGKAHDKLAADYERLKRHISNNGLWRAVKELRARIEEMHTYQDNMATVIRDLETNGVEARQEPSLAAKVDAIIAHLGIEVSVEPEKVVKTPAKIVAKKVKAPKKGRR